MEEASEIADFAMLYRVDENSEIVSLSARLGWITNR